MSDKKYIIYFRLNMSVKKLYVSTPPNEYDWDFSSNIEWAGLFGLERAEAFKERSRKELGFELVIEEVNEDNV